MEKDMATNHLRPKTAEPQRATATTSRQAALRSSSPLTILLLLACVHQSSQLPVSSRPYDSSGSLVERAERQSDWQPQDSVNASKFILTVYNDIVSRPTTTANQLQPNIVRSINASPGSSCDEFYFNLASINEREIVYRADFRLTLRFNRKSNGIWPSGYAVRNTDTGILPFNRITNTSGDTYTLIVNVDQMVTGWVFNLDSYPSKSKGFKLLFFPTPDDYYNKHPINTCTDMSPITFVPSSMNDGPALVMYSRDPDANLIAAQALLRSLSDSGTTVKRDVERQARGSAPAACGLNSLILQSTVLNTIPLLPNQTIIYPQSFDGGICGGQCYGSYPDNSSPTIALISHFVTRTAGSNAYKQCCVPIQYAPQTFVSLPLGTSGGVTTLTTLDNMRVTKCSCLDVTN